MRHHNSVFHDLSKRVPGNTFERLAALGDRFAVIVDMADDLP